MSEDADVTSQAPITRVNSGGCKITSTLFIVSWKWIHSNTKRSINNSVLAHLQSRQVAFEVVVDEQDTVHDFRVKELKAPPSAYWICSICKVIAGEVIV